MRGGQLTLWELTKCCWVRDRTSPKPTDCDKSRHGPAAACPKPPCLYQLAVCLLFFPGLSSAQQKCRKTSSVVNCCTSLHAHGAGCLLLLLLLLFSHCLGALRPPASLHQPAPCRLRCSQASALRPLTSRLLLPPPPLPSASPSGALVAPSPLGCTAGARRLRHLPCPEAGVAFRYNGWR